MIKICKIVSLQFLRYKLEHNQISRSEVDKVGYLIKMIKGLNTVIVMKGVSVRGRYAFIHLSFSRLY